MCRGPVVPMLLWTLLLCSILCSQARAAFVSFENCLDPIIINSSPLQLQFIPSVAAATFNTTDSSHNMNVTVWGNVSGSATPLTPLPPPTDRSWTNPNITVGKIADIEGTVASTLSSKVTYLSYTPYQNYSRFCDQLINGTCPLGPVFVANSTDISRLPAFSLAHQFYSTYSFTTFSATLRLTSGGTQAIPLACISVSVTPDLGRSLSNLLTYLPLAILLLVGAATISAAIYSPWGSADIFKWTSNYGRDVDVLRLITPGFGDCLQYIQYVVLTGALSLNYPGYYQPVVSQASWSTLMFNASFVSHASGRQSLADGIYIANGTYGLDRLSQLVGMADVEDIWTGMTVWLLSIITCVTGITLVGFLVQWGYRHLSGIQEEDLRHRNLPFAIGNVVRILFNFFFLPIVALSMFQLVIALQSHWYTTALAAVLLLILLLFATRVVWLISRTKPRSFLFDDLETVLLYGPLYNTYSDDAAPFAMITIFLTFIRGVAIGAVQPSGIAQLVLLAICEVVQILTLHAIRPFAPPTSMNAYHTFFATTRLVATLLSVAFVPSLGVSEGPKGWIGYAILLLHAVVLVFGFFLNAIQTLIEVGARLAGAGGEAGGAARGGLTKVFGMRQLSRRTPRRDVSTRLSAGSNAAMLSPSIHRKSDLPSLIDTRARSPSGSSAVLLNRHGRPNSISVVSPGGHNRAGSGSGPYTPTTPGAMSAFSYVPVTTSARGSITGGLTALRSAEPTDPYYRPPRHRRPTIEGPQAGPTHGGGSQISGDGVNREWSTTSADRGENGNDHEGPSISGRETPVPAYLGFNRQDSDANINNSGPSRTDFAVREVDFYYGVRRGPALSDQPTRKLRTGPADPTGPVASASGWFKGLWGGKTKDKGKGFEVVRGARMPPSAERHSKNNTKTDLHSGILGTDTNPGIQAVSRAIYDGPDANPDGETSSLDSYHDDEDDGRGQSNRISEFPPTLPVIDSGDGIELPSRIASKNSRHTSIDNSQLRSAPSVPRKSSKRNTINSRSYAEGEQPFPTIGITSPSRTTIVPQTRLNDPIRPQHRQFDHLRTLSPTSRLPFDSESVSTLDPRHTTYSSGSSSHRHFSSDDIEHHDPAFTDNSSSVLGAFANEPFHDRKTSVGYVQQHRASDNIHKVGLEPGGSPVDLIGSAAEVFDAGRGRSASFGRRI
ncbi:MAG: hypothetical protein M1829_000998 [Trizodia sp. TS-e1964]|nr:MAG: hypothetical protein M1829_000998 [Trizodia sp. TS-e1964]